MASIVAVVYIDGLTNDDLDDTAVLGRKVESALKSAGLNSDVQDWEQEERDDEEDEEDEDKG